MPFPKIVVPPWWTEWTKRWSGQADRAAEGWVETADPGPEAPEVPEAFRRRFDDHPLTEPAQLRGRAEDLADLTARLGGERFDPVLLTATPGAGMGSVLRCLPSGDRPWTIVGQADALEEEEALAAALARAFGRTAAPGGLPALAEALRDAPPLPRPRVAFENVERLMRRRVDGFGLLEAFLSFLTATGDRVDWLVTANRYADEYLEGTRSWHGRFAAWRRLGPLADDAVAALAMARLDGYALRWLKPARLPARLARELDAASADAVQDRLQEHFLESLARYARGLPATALHFVREALVHVREDLVYLREPQPFPAARPDDEALYLLEALLQHGRLRADELVGVLRRDPAAVQADLDALRRQGMIQALPGEGPAPAWRVNPLFLPALEPQRRGRLYRDA
jgi:hypothetical protein